MNICRQLQDLPQCQKCYLVRLSNLCRGVTLLSASQAALFGHCECCHMQMEAEMEEEAIEQMIRAEEVCLLLLDILC